MTALGDLVEHARQFRFALIRHSEGMGEVVALVRSLREAAELAGWPAIIVRIEVAEANVDQVCEGVLDAGDLVAELIAALEPLAQARLDQIDAGLAATFGLLEQVESAVDAGGSLLEEVRDDLVAATGEPGVGRPFDAVLERVEAHRSGLNELRDRASEERQAIHDAHAIGRARHQETTWNKLRSSRSGAPSSRPRSSGVKRAGSDWKAAQRAKASGDSEIPRVKMSGAARVGILGGVLEVSWAEVTNFMHLPPGLVGVGIPLVGAVAFFEPAKEYVAIRRARKKGKHDGHRR